MHADYHTDFEDLFRVEFATLERTAFLIIGDRELARELTQDAFAEALVRWGSVSRYDRPGAWVRRVLIRKACRTRDRGRRRVELERRGVSAGSAVQGTPLVSIEMRAALDELPVRQRSAVVLTYFLGLTSTEVGESLGCSAATVRTHLHLARQRLAELLEVDFEEEPHAT